MQQDSSRQSYEARNARFKKPPMINSETRKIGPKRSSSLGSKVLGSVEEPEISGSMDRLFELNAENELLKLEQR